MGKMPAAVKKSSGKDNNKRNGQSSKERILKYAAKEFLKKGWEKSNIRNIAKKAGLTTGAVYFHFKNKEALFDDLVKDTYLELLKKQKLMYKRHLRFPYPKRKNAGLFVWKNVSQCSTTHTAILMR